MGRILRIKSDAASGEPSPRAWSAAVGAVIVSLGFHCGAPWCHLLPLHLSRGHVLKEVSTGLLSDVYCPRDFCSSETGMYFRKDLILW